MCSHRGLLSVVRHWEADRRDNVPHKLPSLYSSVLTAHCIRRSVKYIIEKQGNWQEQMCYIHAFVTTLGISLMLQDKIPIGAVLKSKFLCFCQHGSFQDLEE